MPAPQAAVEEPESSTSSTPKAKGKSRDPGTPNRSKKAQRVPAIDLLRGPFEADDSEMRRWSEAETAAFEGKTAWGEAAQLHVTEVGVGPLIATRATC